MLGTVFGSFTILCHFLQRAPQIPSMAPFESQDAEER